MAESLRSKRRHRRGGRKPWGLWLMLGSIGLVAVLIVGGTLWVNSFLRSESFRQLLNTKTGDLLRARCDFRPMHWEGWSVYADGFSAQGSQEAFFGELHSNGMRAEFDIGAIFHGAWRVPLLTVKNVDLELATHGIHQTIASAASSAGPDTPSALAPSMSPSPSGRSWLPQRFELDRLEIERATVRWTMPDRSEGRIAETHVTLLPSANDLSISANGGALIQPGVPKLEIGAVRARYQRQQLFVTEASLRLPEGGTVQVSGESDFRGPSLIDLRADLDRLTITPFLPEDWRARLKGLVSGEVSVHGDPAKYETIKIKGKIALSDGRLEALPFLNEIALFLKTQEFRSMAIQRGEAEFSWQNQTLTIPRFVVESEGLFKMEGSLAVSGKGQLDGLCMVGVSKRTLQWLPGLGSSVFMVERAGYVWTEMKLGGSVERPTEDLSQRVIAAAAGAAIETVNQAVDATKKATDNASKLIQDSASSALDLLRPFATP